MEIKSRYQIDTWEEDELFVAEIWAGKNHWAVVAKTEEELWMDIGDSILTMNEVKVNWWNKMIYKLFIF